MISTFFIIQLAVLTKNSEKLVKIFSYYKTRWDFFYYFFFFNCQFTRTSTNLTGPEVNDHVSLQWPSY